MRLEVHGILADANCEGHLALLLGLFHQHWRQEVWEFLRLAQVSFADLRLPPAASDREVWEVCQRAHVVLVTANRNDAGPESLEATIQPQNTPQSLPVCTRSASENRNHAAACDSILWAGRREGAASPRRAAS